jgi:MFS family permease
VSLASRSEAGVDPSTQRAALFTRPFLLLLAMQGAFGFALSIFLLLPKFLAAECLASPSQIGVVMASFGVASLASIPLVARAMVAFDHRRSLVISNLVLALGAFGFLLVSGAGPLAAALRGLHGLAWSLGFAGGMALVAELAPITRLGQAIGIFGAASLGMTAIGPAVAEPLAAAVGYRAVFLLGGLAALAATALARRLPRLPPLGEGKTAGVGTRDQPEGRALGYPRHQAGAIFLVLATGALAMGVMFTFLAPFALARGITAVRGFFIAYTLSALTVRIVVGPLADRIGHGRIAVASAPVYGLVVVAAGVFGPAHLTALGIGFGCAHGAIFPALMTLLLGGADRHQRARLVGRANGSMNLGLAAVFLVGLGAERVGYPPMFILAGALMAATTLLLVRARTDER